MVFIVFFLRGVGEEMGNERKLLLVFFLVLYIHIVIYSHIVFVYGIYVGFRFMFGDGFMSFKKTTGWTGNWTEHLSAVGDLHLCQDHPLVDVSLQTP